MSKVAIILGSTRPNRNGEAVANWVWEHAKLRDDADFQLIDLRDFQLPLLDEPEIPYLRRYTHPYTKKWSETIDSFDGFVFVTPEYNSSTSGALKNAIDFLYHEWSNKVAGFVGYGGNGAIRAVEHLRQIMGALGVADVHAQVVLSLTNDFKDFHTFSPAAHQLYQLNQVFDQVVAWTKAMKYLRLQKAPQPTNV